MVKNKKNKKSVLVTLRIYATWNAQVVSMVTYIPRMTAPNCGLRYVGRSGGGGGVIHAHFRCCYKGTTTNQLMKQTQLRPSCLEL